jgi:hypothetical protein
METFEEQLRIAQIPIIVGDDSNECQRKESVSFYNWKTQLDTLREECISLVYLLSKAKQGIISSIEDNLGDHVILSFQRERDHLFVQIKELLLRIEEGLNADLNNWEEDLDSLSEKMYPIDRMYSDVKRKIIVSIQENRGDAVIDSYRRARDHLWMEIEELLWLVGTIFRKRDAAYEILEEIRRFRLLN